MHPIHANLATTENRQNCWFIECELDCSNSWCCDQTVMRSRQSGLFCVGERRGSTSAVRVVDDRNKLGAHPRPLTIPFV